METDSDTVGPGSNPNPPALNRSSWHRPLISIIVTHRNYSRHIQDALLSVIDQSYANWECVIVDDASDHLHRTALEAILLRLNHPKIILMQLGENVGQIPAFFAGLAATSGEFVCLLDPDDRYAETFLEEALAAHLNRAIYCPIVSANQQLLGEHGVITGIYTWHNKRFLRQERGVMIVPNEIPDQLMHFPAEMPGWHWSSTSAMMFRRSALRYLKPHKQLDYKGSADSYLANGAHRLGGTLLLTKPLVYRLLHADNRYLTQHIFAPSQDKRRPNRENRTQECIVDVVEAIIANGGEKYLPKPKEPTMPLPEPATPALLEQPPQRHRPTRQTMMQRWVRSARKWK